MHSVRLPRIHICALSVALVTLAGLLPPRPAGADPRLWSPNVGGNAHFYELVEDSDGLTWDAARRAAEGRRWQGMVGHLAVISSPEENTWVWAELDRPAGCWLGGVRGPASTGSADDWQWLTGDVWSFENWAPDQPGGGDGERALRYAPDDLSGQWSDDCAACPGAGYVVEYAPASTPADRQTWGDIKGLF